MSADAERPTKRKGSFARQALLDGLSQEASGNGNPFKYGFIGDTDTHNAAGSNEEFNYTGKFAFENDPKDRMIGQKGQPPAQVEQIREFSSGGLAGVWAEQNTREAIFDAMLRKETFGTSGPMIKVRFFASWELTADDLKRPDFIKRRVREGRAHGRRPEAGRREGADVLRDGDEGSEERQSRSYPDRQRVDRRGGRTARSRFTMSSGAATASPAPTASLPPVGNTVDVAHATYTNSIGAAELSSAWTDPDFKRERARVLLRSRAGDSHATLEHHRRSAARHGHSGGLGGDHSGTRVEFVDLVRAGLTIPPRRDSLRLATF